MSTLHERWCRLRAVRLESESIPTAVSALVIGIWSELLLGSLLPEVSLLESFGRVLVVMGLVGVFSEFTSRRLGFAAPVRKDILTLVTLILGSVGMIWITVILTRSVSTYVRHVHVSLFEHVTQNSLLFSVPIGAAALALQPILGPLHTLSFGLVVSSVTALYIPFSPLLWLFVLVQSLVASHALQKLRNRLAFIQAGTYLFCTALFFALSQALLYEPYSQGLLITQLICALVSAVLSVLVAAGITPLIELIGGYVTDIRLIEMATLDHPLLKELSIQAPGTWNHSMVMGMMAETAAEAIGANSVLARVGCYFHDVGKLKKPLYFVENQMGGENRHDKLSPSMSALIIRAHVKEGIELARKYKLPRAIEDMIPQHHGTSLIEYFYDKAMKEGRDEGEVDKSLYTYPGPRPQTREAGILMLADGIEAASRTLADMTPDRVQGMVQKMINKVFASGELDESELTLRDLHVIAKSFTRVLSGILHQRISYSEPVEKVSHAAREGGSEPRRESDGSQDEGLIRDLPKDKLKRLGM
jgi:cyclic-di-AMP phosphodiesterase PgpH